VLLCIVCYCFVRLFLINPHYYIVLQSFEGFEKLLVDNGVQVNAKILNRILETQAPRMINCLRFDQAIKLYEEISLIPQTTTMALLAGTEFQILLNGIFLQGSKSILVNALDHGIPKIFKIPSNRSDAIHEGNIGEMIIKFNCPFLVPVRLVQVDVSQVQLLSTENRGDEEHLSVRYGIIMPKYAGVASQYSKVDIGTILKWLKHVLVGLNVFHTAQYAHCDVKPMNIFLIDDIAVLGDYGAVTKFGDNMRECSVVYIPIDFGDLKANIELDFYALGLTALELLGVWSPTKGSMTKASILTEIRRSPLPIADLFSTFNFSSKI
jgi:hypothetical protein